MEREIIVPLADDEEAAEHTGYDDGRNYVSLDLSNTQKRTLRCMVIAMQKRNVEVAMPRGRRKRVENRADAIRWLLDQVGRAQ